MKNHRAEWLFNCKWGVFMHFLGPVVDARGNDFTAEEWNALVDGFDVAGLARQLVEVKAPYFCITIGQNSGHFCAPNPTYDRLTGISPSKCSRRDLVADLYEALNPHGIQLLVYLPSAAPCNDSVACRTLEWNPQGRERFANFQRKWEAVIRDWSLRWGDKVRGWWIDGCYTADEMYRHPDAPNFKSFADAMRAGNPGSIVAWNPGVLYPPIVMDAEEDYTAGEINESELVDSPGRWVGHAQFHMLSYLGPTWARGPLRFSDRQAIAQTRRLTDYGGVVTWDVLPQRNGLIAEPFFLQLKAIGDAIESTRALRILPPPRYPRVSVTFPTSPIAGADGRRWPGILRLTLTNQWDSVVAGHVKLDAEPAAAVTFDRTDVGVNLPPGGTATEDIRVSVGARVKPEAVITVLLRRDGDENVLHCQLPIRRELLLSCAPEAHGLQDVPAATSNATEHAIVVNGQEMGRFRFAVAGDKLAIAARIHDRRIHQTPTLWDGSCVEVFLSPVVTPDIHQYLLIPSASELPSHVHKFQAGQIRPVPDVLLATKADSEGYALSALIPLLRKPEGDGTSFLLEIAVSASVTSSGSICRGTLCGSPSAYNSAAFYALARKA